MIDFTKLPQMTTQPTTPPIGLPPLLPTGYDQTQGFVVGDPPSGDTGYPYGQYDPYGQINMPFQDFNMPQEWTQAADFYRNAMGGGVGASPYWGTAGNTFTQMAQGGMPVDVSGLYGAMLPVATRQLEDFQKQAAESAGVGGIR